MSYSRWPSDAVRREMQRLKPGEKRSCFTDHSNFGVVALRSQKDVAIILGVTRQAVQQVERMALHKLRTALRREGYR